MPRAPRPAIAALALVLAVLAAPDAGAGGDDLTGQPAPELTLAAGLNGATAKTTLQSLRGKVVLLKFWLVNCPRCAATLPEFQALHERYARNGVVCLSVVVDQPEGAAPYVKERGYTFGVGCDPDGRSASRYGVRLYPADYVIGADGIVRASNGFPRDAIEEELRKQRLVELGDVPAAMSAVRDAVEAGDYGAALRAAETSARTEGAADDVKAAAGRVLEIASRRLENRFARADALAAAGKASEAKAELERAAKDFAGTSLEARAKERLAAAK